MAVKDKDQTIIDFEGFVDGTAFEGGKGTDYPLTIGSHSFIDNFEEQLIGAKIGSEVEVNVTFPENYQAAELAGKPALFKVTVKEIKVKELPKLDDEFAKEVSEFDTLSDYKADLKKQLTDKKKEEAKNEKRSKAVAKAVANASIDIPEAMIKAQVNNMVNEMAQRFQMQGLSIEQYLQYTGSDPQAFMESLRPEAETRIRNSLVLEAVVKAENIEVTDKDYEDEIARMAEMYKMETDGRGSSERRKKSRYAETLRCRRPPSLSRTRRLKLLPQRRSDLIVLLNESPVRHTVTGGNIKEV